MKPEEWEGLPQTLKEAIPGHLNRVRFKAKYITSNYVLYAREVLVELPKAIADVDLSSWYEDMQQRRQAAADALGGWAIEREILSLETELTLLTRTDIETQQLI